MVSRHLKAVVASDKGGAVELTTAHIKALQARSDATEVRISDSVEPGLCLRRDPRNGSVSFVYRGRIRGAEGSPIVKLRIGPATNAKSLAKARTEAVALRAKLASGISPSAERKLKAAETRAAEEVLRQRHAAEEQLQKWTPAYALVQMLEWRASRPDPSLHFKPETIEFYQRGIRYLGKLASKPIAHIDSEDIRSALEKVGGVAKPAKAKRALSGVIAFALKRMKLNISNPVTNLERGEFKAPAPRTSYIKETDIGEFVGRVVALPALPASQGKVRETERARDYLLLALLYGTRKEELMRMEWSWIDWQAGTITLPASVTKQKKTHVLPLTAWTREILKRRYDARKPEVAHVFPGNKRDQPLTNIRRSVVRAYGEGFKLDDLRRTLLTHCASLGIHGGRAKALVGHARVGVTELYDQREIEQARRDFTTYHEWVRARHDDWERDSSNDAYYASPEGQAQGALQAADDAEYEAWAAQQPHEPSTPQWPGM